ncbi:MAG: hypothetical protein EKK41_05910 [Hyphomicrobiales bacterium]|nr:MAG: hypothetical protein EKK41_05910 [Hyphomicrobiales bacterium]
MSIFVARNPSPSGTPMTMATCLHSVPASPMRTSATAIFFSESACVVVPPSTRDVCAHPASPPARRKSMIGTGANTRNMKQLAAIPLQYDWHHTAAGHAEAIALALHPSAADV